MGKLGSCPGPRDFGGPTLLLIFSTIIIELKYIYSLITYIISKPELKNQNIYIPV